MEATAPADEFPIEDILAAEYDVIPLGGCIDSIGDRVAPAEAERFLGTDSSARPPYADSTSQRRGMERGFLRV